MKLSILLLSILPFGLFAQKFEKERDFHFGVATNFVTSAMHLPGVNLTAFAEFKKHQIAFGSRYSYAQNNVNFFNSAIKTRSSSSIILDFNYKYYLLNRTNRFNPFIQLSSELYTRKDETTFFYDPNASGPEIDPSQGNDGPSYPYSFNGSSNANGAFVGVYIGVGAEMKIWKGLFGTFNVGVGRIGGKSNLSINDEDNNELVLSKSGDFYWNNRMAFTGSIGLGYRF